MPHLYCETHGRDREAQIIRNQDKYRQEGESMLVVRGRLTCGPFLCDRCNRELAAGQTAWLISALPGWVAEGLTDYDFGYEREYFAMAKTDMATAYGAGWPDDSIRRRRPFRRPGRQAKSPPPCALDFPRPKPPGE
jgi:hypothetical protein